MRGSSNCLARHCLHHLTLVTSLHSQTQLPFASTLDDPIPVVNYQITTLLCCPLWLVAHPFHMNHGLSSFYPSFSCPSSSSSWTWGWSGWASHTWFLQLAWKQQCNLAPPVKCWIWATTPCTATSRSNAAESLRWTAALDCSTNTQSQPMPKHAATMPITRFNLVWWWALHPSHLNQSEWLELDSDSMSSTLSEAEGADGADWAPKGTICIPP